MKKLLREAEKAANRGAEEARDRRYLLEIARTEANWGAINAKRRTLGQKPLWSCDGRH